MQTYGRLPIGFVRGEGAWLFDERGEKYLDALTGVAVCGLGHAHPAIAKAVCDQASTLLHTSNWYQIPLQEQLADRLCRLAGMETVFFCNSGAEANEAAIKLARLYGHQREIKQPSIIVTEGSFHGRTLATLSATGNRKIQAGFEPLVSGFNRVPYNDLDAIRQVGDNNANVVAVLVEPILGEGGVVIPDRGYLKGLREICDKRNWLLMLDEIQTGMGRTGRWFAAQHDEVLPDVMTLAKALGNGVPIGACLARATAAGVFRAGNHGSTFGGNPLACRAALTVIDTLEQNNFIARAATLGQRLLSGLQTNLDGVAGIKEIRGHGLMLRVALDRPCAELLKIALDHRLLINVTAGNIVRLLPPLILTDAEADELVTRLGAAIRQFLASGEQAAAQS